VVLAIELSLMCNVVGWAYSTSTMGAFETAPMICSSIHSHLLNWINGLVTPHTFLPGAAKHVGNLAGILAISLFFWFHDFRRSFETLVEAPSSLEELIKVRPAVKNPLKRVEVAELEGTSAVVASEASLVINSVVSS